jgi:uncharacterized membrane protein
VFSLLSAGCLFLLQRLQPLFFVVAVAALIYQVWMVGRRPPSSRTRRMKIVLATSVVLNVLMIGSWAVLAIRYR